MSKGSFIDQTAAAVGAYRAEALRSAKKIKNYPKSIRDLVVSSYRKASMEQKLSRSLFCKQVGISDTALEAWTSDRGKEPRERREKKIHKKSAMLPVKELLFSSDLKQRSEADWKAFNAGGQEVLKAKPTALVIVVWDIDQLAGVIASIGQIQGAAVTT